MNPEQRIKLAVELAEQAMACMQKRPAEAVGLLREAQRQLGQARGTLWARVEPKWWKEDWG